MLNINQNNILNKITLIGMMGTGKSKFGRILSNNLNYIFYDIDLLIEKKFHITIKEIFKKYGEHIFRNEEKKIIKDLIFKVNKNNEKVIISIGGGAFDSKETRNLLLKNTNVIWLNTPINSLVERIGDGSKRPMIKGDTRVAIEKLLKKRTRYYSECHHRIDTYKLSQNQVTEKLIYLITHRNIK